MNDQSIKAVRQFIRDELKSIYPEREIVSLTRLILLETSGLTQTEILLDPLRSLSHTTWDKINKICSQLKENKPVQYILGKAEFYGLQLKVDKYTLIPRQETEELADLVIKENQQAGLRLIDLGCGSGALAIALCKNLDRAFVTATDLSDKALLTASLNSKAHKCNISFLKDDILDSSIKGDRSFDLMVSNPPYIRESEKSTMHPNVLEYEPASALFVRDDDPLVFYRSLGRLAETLLKPGGKLYFEINEALGQDTCNLLERLGLSNIRLIKDINNKDRIVSAISI